MNVPFFRQFAVFYLHIAAKLKDRGARMFLNTHADNPILSHKIFKVMMYRFIASKNYSVACYYMTNSCNVF